MRRWLGKLRGLLGLGVLGGAAGAVVGGLWWVGATLLGIGEIAFGSLGWTLALWSGFCASATTAVGALLATFGSKSTLEDLSPWPAVACGAVIGLLAPGAVAFLLTGTVWVTGVGLLGGVSGLLGGVLGGGFVIMAKRARTAELRAARDLDTVGPGS